MSYSHYQHNTTGTSYPYAAYHPGTPGAYQAQGYAAAYQSAYASGVTGYGAWPYPYSYIPQQQTQNSAQVARSAAQSPLAPATATAAPAAVATPRPTTFSSYTPTYVRETGAALGTTTAVTGRGRKHANFKGLFTKERQFVRDSSKCYIGLIVLAPSQKSNVWFRRRQEPGD